MRQEWTQILMQTFHPLWNRFDSFEIFPFSTNFGHFHVVPWMWYCSTRQTCWATPRYASSRGHIRGGSNNISCKVQVEEVTKSTKIQIIEILLLINLSYLILHNHSYSNRKKVPAFSRIMLSNTDHWVYAELAYKLDYQFGTVDLVSSILTVDFQPHPR